MQDRTSIRPENDANFNLFQDALSTQLVARFAPGVQQKPAKRRRTRGKGRGKGDRLSGAGFSRTTGRVSELVATVDSLSSHGEHGGVIGSSDGMEDEGAVGDAAALGDFTHYLACEIFTALPPVLQTLSHTTVREDESGTAEWASLPLTVSTVETAVGFLPQDVIESLIAYGTVENSTALESLMRSVLEGYIASAIVVPPELSTVSSGPGDSGCEICGREHLPLTYHHLIPRAVHAKVLKRGWHKEWELQKVAWLCRACHSFVHRIASNEELAREWFSVDRLMMREDVASWAAWVGKVRWKAR